jgi:serine/threonine-protein kinase
LEDLGQKNEQIPQLYAYGEEQGQFYLVQEYIDGETLSTKVGNRGVLGDAAVRDILLKLLAVLVYVHDHRIVHRDIKPDNIILRRGDELPVLIDFGAVKETMGTVMTAAGNPTSSIVIGTPGFMPSEQSIGRPVYATDLYALGLTAIYLLTGKVPQELATDPLTGEIQWRDHAPGVSPSLALVLDKAIKSHYQERFPTAQAMQEALAPSSSRSTIVLPPSPPSTAVHPPAPQSRGGDWLKFGIVGGVMGLVLLAGFVYLQDQQQHFSHI